MLEQTNTGMNHLTLTWMSNIRNSSVTYLDIINPVIWWAGKRLMIKHVTQLQILHEERQQEIAKNRSAIKISSIIKLQRNSTDGVNLLNRVSADGYNLIMS